MDHRKSSDVHFRLLLLPSQLTLSHEAALMLPRDIASLRGLQSGAG